MTNLIKYLNKIPSGRLRHLVGQDICDAIVNYNIYINNLTINYAEILQINTVKIYYLRELFLER